MIFDTDQTETIFECIQCGECCKGYGGTFVNEEDIRNIADFLKIAPKDVLSGYCSESGGKPLLAVADNGYCVFWDKICTIHPVKPYMCRAWPYLKSIFKDITNWQAMASCCPGMKKDASPESIQKIVQHQIEQLESKDRQY